MGPPGVVAVVILRSGATLRRSTIEPTMDRSTNPSMGNSWNWLIKLDSLGVEQFDKQRVRRSQSRPWPEVSARHTARTGTFESATGHPRRSIADRSSQLTKVAVARGEVGPTSRFEFLGRSPLMIIEG